ncbi:MAG: hypothetical protein II508_07630 [Acholeplasmatales bacterium]|nr:hypothetical protein [Acholeplasmatales bacterium]
MEEKKEILKDHGSLVATAIMDLLAGIEGIVFLIVLGANIPSNDEYGRTVFTVIFWISLVIFIAMMAYCFVGRTSLIQKRKKGIAVLINLIFGLFFLTEFIACFIIGFSQFEYETLEEKKTEDEKFNDFINRRYSTINDGVEADFLKEKYALKTELLEQKKTLETEKNSIENIAKKVGLSDSQILRKEKIEKLIEEIDRRIETLNSTKMTLKIQDSPNRNFDEENVEKSNVDLDVLHNFEEKIVNLSEEKKKRFEQYKHLYEINVYSKEEFEERTNALLKNI